MPDSPVAKAPSQNAASSSKVVSAAGASVPSGLRNGARGCHSPRTESASNSSRARSPRSLSVPHAKHARETGSRWPAPLPSGRLGAPFSACPVRGVTRPSTSTLPA